MDTRAWVTDSVLTVEMVEGWTLPVIFSYSEVQDEYAPQPSGPSTCTRGSATAPPTVLLGDVRKVMRTKAKSAPLVWFQTRSSKHNAAVKGANNTARLSIRATHEVDGEVEDEAARNTRRRWALQYMLNMLAVPAWHEVETLDNDTTTSAADEDTRCALCWARSPRRSRLGTREHYYNNCPALEDARNSALAAAAEAFASTDFVRGDGGAVRVLEALMAAHKGVAPANTGIDEAAEGAAAGHPIGNEIGLWVGVFGSSGVRTWLEELGGGSRAVPVQERAIVRLAQDMQRAGMSVWRARGRQRDVLSELQQGQQQEQG